MINRKKLQFEIISKKLTYRRMGRKDTFLWNFIPNNSMIILRNEKEGYQCVHKNKSQTYFEIFQ
ncbi:hypothetical protein COL83_29310 [Bacillus wiedmannii]|nr:hypothetical protein COL83_29310 [Bacillus wiedmannii]